MSDDSVTAHDGLTIGHGPIPSSNIGALRAAHRGRAGAGAVREQTGSLHMGAHLVLHTEPLHELFGLPFQAPCDDSEEPGDGRHREEPLATEGVNCYAFIAKESPARWDG